MNEFYIIHYCLFNILFLFCYFSFHKSALDLIIFDQSFNSPFLIIFQAPLIMFVSTAKPFKLASYKKNGISQESRIAMMSSYTCVKSPAVVMAGTVVNKNLLICKKDVDGSLLVGGKRVEIEKERMTLQNMLLNFKESDGLDFIVLNLEPYFLITRQPSNKISIYMTTTPDYVQMFSNPKKMFGEYPEIVHTFDTVFKLEKREKSKEKFKSKSQKEINEDGELEEVKRTDENKANEENNGNEIELKEIDKNIKEDEEKKEEKADVKETIQPEISNSDDKTSNADDKLSNAADENFSVNIGTPLSDEEFQQLLIKNQDLISLKYGRLENGVIKYTRQPIKRVENESLTTLFDYFSFGPYDFVEICGRTKFAGYKYGKEFIWYAELPQVPTEEHCYIIEVAKAMHLFTITQERKQ